MTAMSRCSAPITFLLFFLLLGTQTLGVPLVSTSDSTDITDINECLCSTDTSPCSPEELRKRGETCKDSLAQQLEIISKRDDNSTDTTGDNTDDNTDDDDGDDEDYPTKTPDVVTTSNRTTTTTSPSSTPSANQKGDASLLGHPGWTLVLATLVTMAMVG